MNEVGKYHVIMAEDKTEGVVMTLIMAESDKDDGFFVGDTLLTVVPSLEKSGPFNGEYHALKLHILSPKICIALAGYYELGLTVIHKVSQYVSQPDIENSIFELVHSIYKNECGGHLNACEFLVMAITPQGTCLKKISYEGIWHFKKSYIGDPEAYKELQRIRLPFQAPTEELVQQSDGSFIQRPFVLTDLEKNFIEISNAMIILPSNTVGVLGDGVFRVRVNRFGIFEYMQQVRRGNSAEEINIGISLLSSTEPRYGIGIFYQAGFGYCWIVGDSEYCRRIDANTISDFIEIASKNYNLSLKGGTW
ncbi:hypothetical protein [Legionella feeleii]|uniref:hypothetical protein n=1 Tax=Legionella feeleii TaxID=453 RepID=UPI0011BE9841|nr:hypothetical protein [Legionella feeleii]